MLLFDVVELSEWARVLVRCDDVLVVLVVLVVGGSFVLGGLIMGGFNVPEELLECPDAILPLLDPSLPPADGRRR